MPTRNKVDEDAFDCGEQRLHINIAYLCPSTETVSLPLYHRYERYLQLAGSSASSTTLQTTEVPSESPDERAVAVTTGYLRCAVGMMAKSLDAATSSILIIGCGTWGSSTALHLARRGYKHVTVLDSHELPSAISAGNDINKIVEQGMISHELSAQR